MKDSAPAAQVRLSEREQHERHVLNVALFYRNSRKSIGMWKNRAYSHRSQHRRSHLGRPHCKNTTRNSKTQYISAEHPWSFFALYRIENKLCSDVFIRQTKQCTPDCEEEKKIEQIRKDGHFLCLEKNNVAL